VNVVDAAATGASNAVSLAANIAANLIAFIALLQFINSTLTWFGQRVGLEKFTFEVSDFVLTSDNNLIEQCKVFLMNLSPTARKSCYITGLSRVNGVRVVLKHETSTLRQIHSFKFGVGDYVKEFTSPAKFGWI